MKAVTWQGKRDVLVETVPDPVISEPTSTTFATHHLPLEQAPQAYEMFQ